uniref:Zinc finger protein n=1 Tax=Rhipicephalus appendiculatus TaxID=34631 RepID=A0A131YH37_RHIAP
MIADCKTYQERKEILEALGSSRGILTRAADGSVRYCEQCGLIKPDRCHHCSCCRRFSAPTSTYGLSPCTAPRVTACASRQSSTRIG